MPQSSEYLFWVASWFAPEGGGGSSVGVSGAAEGRASSWFSDFKLAVVVISSRVSDIWRQNGIF